MTALPAELGQLRSLERLYLHSNQLGIPFEVQGPVHGGGEPASPRAILDYYFRLQAGN